MAKSNLLNTRTTNFLELLANGRIYRVPPYQRDYSWEEPEWEDLWNDLLELRAQPGDRHYMGAIVVQAVTDREFEIIDGQQRLATLSILALAVIDRLRKLADQGVAPEANRERASGLRNRFIGEKDPASLVESSKLFLNETNNGFYQDYLVQLRPPLNVRGLVKSNQLLWGCFRYFSSRLDEIAEFKTDGEALAAFLAETVARQLLFILITVEDELNAYGVFETLNARGLALSTTDLLKNYLFSRLRVSTDLDALQRRWRSLIATVTQERFPEFLRYHLMTDLPRVRGERLFKIVRERVRTAPEVFALMDALEGRAELFSALSDPNHGYWIEARECQPFVRELNLFRVRQLTPLLFAAWERLPREEFARVLKLVSVISFRYSVVSGLNANALEPESHVAARGVLDGAMRTPREIFEKLRAIYVEDDRFQSNLADWALSTGSLGKKLTKYVLSRLESDRSGRACDPETDPGTIEHILPENPSQYWAATFPERLWETSVYRLGNLTLLESSLNRRVANADYAEKVQAYAQSHYVLTRDVAEEAPEQWTPELLEKRQRRLAARGVHLWRADFAGPTR